MSDSPTKPQFSDTRGLNMAMQSIPPFEFEGVTMRVFPLRAKVEIIQRFIDAYLNVVPHEVGYFRAYLPYVFLDIINYGRMSAVAANLGWLSQREIAFSVPLEWYEKRGGRLVFRDWAYLSPFIYVDSNLSMTTGREVYGWPKALIKIEKDESEWMKDPRMSGRLATIHANVFPEVYAGKREQARPFLEVERVAAPSPFQIPLDFQRLLGPWMDPAGVLANTQSLLGDWMRLLAGLGVTQRHDGASPENAAAMAERLFTSYRPYDTRPYFNTVNLKQFRSADAPSLIAYQALTNARMDITSWNGGGMLGDPQMVMGDPSGGLRVLIHRYASEPVVETLGIEVDEEWHGEHTNVASVKPVFPYWVDLDMKYNRAHTEAWRTKVTDWTAADGRPVTPRASKDPPAYNTARGAASQQIGGPFEFPDTTLRVLPLLAERGPLEEFCKAYLNDPLSTNDMRFEPWGTYVYLVIGSNEGALSESNNVGYWAGRDVTFYVPVKWYQKVGNEERLRTLALVPVFSYANSTTAANTGSEVSGIPTVQVAIASPASTWLDDAGPSDASERRFLRMIAEVLPVLGEGQRAEHREILDVRDGLVLPANDDTGWRFIAQSWGRRLKDDLARMRDIAKRDEGKRMDDARTLALEVLANGEPINILTMKQFRDGDDPTAACYQSLVQIRRKIQRISDIREIESRLYVRIHDYASQPIVKTLGLVPKRVAGEGAAVIAEIEPVRPFWMKVAIREELGVTICRRAGSVRWEKDPDDLDPKKKLHPYFEAGSKPRVGGELTTLVDAWVPQRLRPQAETWLRRIEAEKKDEERLDIESARLAVEAIEPQMIIGSLLSREWENWGNPRWWQLKSALAGEMDRIEKDALMQDAVDEELARLTKELDRVARATRRRDALDYIERESLLEKLRAAGRLLQGLARTHDLVHAIEKLHAGLVFIDGHWSGSPAGAAIQAGTAEELKKVFINPEMFDVLDEALRVCEWDLRGKGIPPRGEVFLDWLAGELEAAPEKKPPLAGQAEVLCVAWFTQARDELERLLLNDKERLGVIGILHDAAIKAGIHVDVDPEVDPGSYLQAVWHAVFNRPGKMRAISDEAVKTAKDRYAWVRAALLHALSKAAQKPDFCIPVDTIQGREQSLFFDASECWPDERGVSWYVGPDPDKPQPPPTDAVPLPLVNAAQK
jgi:hypothetical protein